MDGTVIDIDPGLAQERPLQPEVLKSTGSTALNGASMKPADEFTEWGDGYLVDFRAEQIADPRSPHGYTTHPTGW